MTPTPFDVFLGLLDVALGLFLTFQNVSIGVLGRIFGVLSAIVNLLTLGLVG